MLASGPGGEDRIAQLNEVQIGEIKDRNGQQLRNLLIDRFYTDSRPAAPRYRLDVKIRFHEEKLAIQQDASTSRGQWQMFGEYRLIDLGTGAAVNSGIIRAIPGYNISFAPFASQVSQENALQRGLSQIADSLRTRVAMFLARDPDQRPGYKPPG